MDRLTTFTAKWRELDEVSKERTLTGEEQLDMTILFNMIQDQSDVNVRALQSKDASVSTRSSKKVVRRPQLYHLRLSMVKKMINFDRFDKLMTRMAKSDYVQAGMFVYVYEQSGACRDTLGHNPHVHIRFKSKLPFGRLIAKVKRASGLDDAAVKMMEHDNINALRQYMLGHKSDPTKASKSRMDVIWRMKNNLKNEYILS